MLVNFSIKNVLYGVGVLFWTVFALVVGQLVAGLLFADLTLGISQTAKTATIAAIGYTFGLIIAIIVPTLLKKTKIQIDRKALGINHLPAWSDIGLGLLSVLPYYLLAAVVIWIGTNVGLIDPNVGQQALFSHVSSSTDRVLVFITFVAMAPLAEELLFRGYLLGKLRTKWNKWIAVTVMAVTFGLLHAPGFTDHGIVWQWAAAADTFTLALAAGSMRLLTGNIWAGMILHAIKNALAFYVLFIIPLLTGGI